MTNPIPENADMRDPRARGIPSPEALPAVLEMVLGRTGEARPVQDPGAALELLEENTVTCLFVRRTADPRRFASFLESSEFRSAEKRQKTLFERERDQYVLFRDRLVERGHPCVLFKSAGLYPSFTYYDRGNLDVLVRPEAEEEARAVLLGLDYVELLNVEEPAKFLFRRFAGERDVSAIHLHTTVGWGVPFLRIEDLWARGPRSTEDDPAVLVPAAEDAVMILLAHAFMEDKAFKLIDFLRLRHLLARGGIDWEAVRRTAADRGWEDALESALLVCHEAWSRVAGERLLSVDEEEVVRSRLETLPAGRRFAEGALARADPRLPFRIPFYGVKRLYYRKILRDRLRSPARRMADVVKTGLWAVELRLGQPFQSPMLVAVCGPDGSGKTAHAEALVGAFRRCGLRCVRVWTRYGSSRAFGLLARIGKRMLGAGGRSASARGDEGTEAVEGSRARAPAGEEAPREALRRRQALLAGRGARLLASLAVALELACIYFWKVWLPLRLGRVVVCDRYTADALAEWGAVTGNPSPARSVLGVLLRFLTPRPHLGVYLRVRPDTAFARQASAEPIELLERSYEAYEGLLDRERLRVFDAERPFPRASEEVVRECLRAYYARFGPLMKRLFLAAPAQMNPDSRKEAQR
jgi:thymidylate kinase